MNITLCASCPLGQQGFAALLANGLKDAGLAVQLSEVDCMSGCMRGSTLAFRSTGKTAYLFGDLTADDLHDLITFARHYEASADGNLPDARVLGALRNKAIARIPG